MKKETKDKVGHNIAFFGALMESDTDGHKESQSISLASAVS